jgi:cytochrome c
MKRFRIWAICALLGAAGLYTLPAVSAAAKGDPAKGKEVFEQCAVCHNADSDEAKGVQKAGPGLKGLFKRDKLTNGKKPTEANIRAQIDDGGNGMPAYKDLLNDQEKDDLIAYLKTL